MGAYYYDQSTPPDYDNYSLSFDGVDDYVEIDTWGGIQGNFTIETKIKLNSDDNTQTFLSHTANGNNSDNEAGWAFYQTGNVLRWWEKNTNGGYAILDVETDVTDNFWHHVSITREGDNYSIFIDGVPQDSECVNAGDCDYNDSGLPYADNATLKIGNGFYPTNGLVDEVLIWNRALNDNEIQNRANGIVVNDSNLSAFWNFNEGTGTTITDQTSNGNNGTIYGATWSTDVPP
ncbi:uncharacterized protein METZ01_LOCUS343357, partial [marine metagenome]